jgi:uroporphyrinogen decarboxylase
MFGAQAPRRINGVRRNIEIERGAKPAERPPFRHGFERVDRLAGLDLDGALEPTTSLLTKEHDVGDHGQFTGANRGVLLGSGIDHDIELPTIAGLKDTDDPIVLKLLANWAREDRTHRDLRNRNKLDNIARMTSAPAAEATRFLRACRGERVDATPVWFMRQAGRYMPEYRALRQKYTLLQLCRTPDLATEVTLQPLRRIDLDAAIVFSDLLIPLEPMGIAFDFIKGEGPAIEQPIRSAADIDRLRDFEPREALGYVLEAIRQIKGELQGRIPLIGFGGAPFTLASYAIEGGHSNNFALTKSLMYGDPAAWHRFAHRLATTMGEYLIAQIEAGAQAIQVFDSWVGALHADDYREFALPHTRTIFQMLAGHGVPTIHFGVATGSILREMREAGGDVIGVDWRIPLDDAWNIIGADRAVQGNLDPTLLLGPRDRLFKAADDVLRRAEGRLGHIFNLGHGILPPTPVEHVQALARYVHQQTAV